MAKIPDEWTEEQLRQRWKQTYDWSSGYDKSPGYEWTDNTTVNKPSYHDSFYRDLDAMIKRQESKAQVHIAELTSTLDAFQKDNLALLKQTRQFVRLAIELFRRTSHKDGCPTATKPMATCTCGLGDLEELVVRARASLVIEAMNEPSDKARYDAFVDGSNSDKLGPFYKK